MDIGALTLVVVALAVLATHAVVKAVRQRDDVEGRKARARWAVVLILGLMLAVYVEVGHHQRQHLATVAMSAVTDNPHATADCERLTQSLLSARQFTGYVYQARSDVAFYKYQVCKDVWAYAAGHQDHPSVDQIASVHLIAHETMHVNGIWNEAEAECKATQLDYLVAEKLGATPEQARELQARYFAVLYKYNRSDYVSSECREGGEYDIFPDRTEFP